MNDKKHALIPVGRSLWLTALILAGGALAWGQTENVLHAFRGQGGNDGYFPEGSGLVIDQSGSLFGTTTYGGGSPCATGIRLESGCGIIFRLIPPTQAGGSWTYHVIVRFEGGLDGGYPGSLLKSGGHLWGVAGTGGTGACTLGCGYLFELTPPAASGDAWTKTDVFDFPSSAAECGITAVDAGGNFYGAGGATANGNICELVRPGGPGEPWTSVDLYDFKGVPRHQSIGDGSGPMGVTFDSHGNLWGATYSGGFCQRFEGGSCFGAIFILTPPAPGGAWAENIAYRFRNLDQNPTSGLVIDKNDALYGVTYVETYKFQGGFTVIGNFSDIPPNAWAPAGGVAVDSEGNVYGVSAAGGQSSKGTVYKLTPPAYSQTVVYSFAGGMDGWNPEAPPILGPRGVIYGTTQIGGNELCKQEFGSGCGIVFQVIP